MDPIRVVARPTDAVTSVDNALQVLLYLRERPDAGVSEIAEVIDSSPSTAHRILSTLVYRGFVARDESRRYRLGPIMLADPTPRSRLRTLLRPHLLGMRDATGETISAMTREGTRVHTILTVESTQRPRVTDRTGTTLPAAHASVGLALLAHLSPAEVRLLYTGRQARLTGDHLSPQAMSELDGTLEQVRQRGVAFNLGRTERELVAVGCAVPHRDQLPWIGVAAGIPVERRRRVTEGPLVAALQHGAAALGRELDAAGYGPAQLVMSPDHG